MQDVVTRWWSTYAMVEIFLDLLPYVEMLLMRGALLRDEMSTALEISDLKTLKRILKPFMTVQKALEGQKYVTNSLIPYVISTIRDELNETLANAESENIATFVEKLLNDRTKVLTLSKVFLSTRSEAVPDINSHSKADTELLGK